MTITKMKALLFCLLAAVLTSACVSCFVHLNPKVWTGTEQDFELPADGLESLKVKTHNGNIVITGSAEADCLSVHAVIKAGGRDLADAERCLKAMRIKTDVSGSEQQLGVEWIEEKERTWQVCVSFEVILPARLGVKAVLHNGNITVTSLESAADFETHNGNVTATEHRGTLSIDTHNGGILLKAQTAELHCSTHNGEISGELTGTGPLNGKPATTGRSASLSGPTGRPRSAVERTTAGSRSAGRWSAPSTKERS